ncbi:ATP-binding protein [Methylobacterium sp. R2-1]|uniref:ATP-binding protein n=1 Tax=Methylobacterium sp. R2-1 TaxID=2587064 RepID=UPI00160B7DB5|nr:ATP-binding protein [Methylobacterium sp. R2-1]MBB2965216.1 PAS domain S-box-containing protein [Methylobacterium sp. R2-1]
MSPTKVLVLTGAAPDEWTRTHFDAAEWADVAVSFASPREAETAGDAEILIVTPTVADPLARARSFRRVQPSGQVLFVAHPERLERMKGLLPYSPEISEAWVVNAELSDPELRRLVVDAGAEVAGRRAIKGLYGRINARFAPQRDGQDAASTQHDRNLALAERYLSAILANAPDALLAIALDGSVVSWNEAATRLLGRTWDEAAGITFPDLFDPEDRPGALDVLNRAGMGESVRAVELRVSAADGQCLTLEVAAGPVLGGGGAIEGVSLIARDVSGRKRDEASLRQLNEELESRVARAVAEREQTAAALRQAQKMEAVGQLTGGVAHDFNNLLTVIKSSIELLRNPNLVEDRKARYLGAISDTVDRAAKLTGQLLAFARRQPLKPEVFDVAERVTTVTEMLRTIVGARVAVSTEIGCATCFALADVSQFETALVNMAVNARDAMQGEGALTVSVREIHEIPAIRGHGRAKGDFIVVSIRDTGAGIPSDKLGQIFEPFYTTKEVGKGTGLGLSQVFGFAKQSGGDVDVESAVGLGTTFTLYLPRIEAPLNPSETSGIRHEDTAAADHGRRVLLVEDNVEVGKFAVQVLEDLGHRITWATNAAEALSVLAEGSDAFDVVFSDVVMPGMNGIELGRAVRERFPALPVVLTSGYSHVLAQEGRHGFELVQKPYAAGDLSRVLNRVARRMSHAQ